MNCEHLPSGTSLGYCRPGSEGGALSPYSSHHQWGSNSDCSNHLRRIHSDQFYDQHFSISSNQSTTHQFHEISCHQISRLQVQPLTLAMFRAFLYQNSSSMPRSPPASSNSRFRKPFNSDRCFFSSSTLDGEASMRACNRISRDSFNRDQILTNCFLNPQRFDGDMFESSTTTSEHDGTTRTSIHGDE